MRVLILGFAREGQDTLLFLRRLFPDKIIGIADRLEARSLEIEVRRVVERDKKIKAYFGKDYLKSIGGYDIVIKSPGIPLKVVKPFLRKGQILTSQTEIFFNACPGKIIGITGTKGKSTTTALVYEVLKRGGFKAHLVGNIGEPVLSYLSKAEAKDVFVYELSSHQLATLKKSPSIAVFLNIYPEHLDYYKDFREYFEAKKNVCRYQGRDDFFLYNPADKYVAAAAGTSPAKKIVLNPKKAESFLKKCGRSDLPQLLGKFNFLNMAAAIEIGRIFKIPDKKIAQAIENFKPLPHRLEFAGKFNEISFYNDSLATIPEATIAALDALGEKVETILLGGFDRGLDFENLAKRILKSNLKNLIFLPTTGKIIWREVSRLNRAKKRFFNRFFVDTIERGGLSGEKIMKRAIKLVYLCTDNGKICLLSCASPSFGVFRDYRERGELFKKLAKDLAKENDKR